MSKTMDHEAYQAWTRQASTAALIYTGKDAAEAARAMPDNPNVGYYLDEVAYCSMELQRRRTAN